MNGTELLVTVQEMREFSQDESPDLMAEALEVRSLLAALALTHVLDSAIESRDGDRDTLLCE